MRLPLALLVEARAADGGFANSYDTGTIFEIAVETGTTVRANSGRLDLSNIAFRQPTNRAPEPTILTLLGFGLAGLAVFRRRKQQAAAISRDPAPAGFFVLRR